MADEQIDKEGVKDAGGTPPPANPQTETKPDESSAGADKSASAGGDVTPAGKTYTEEQLNAIMHERTKGFADMRKEYERYKELGSPDDLRSKLHPATQPAPQAKDTQPGLDEDDKKFQEYLLKVFPELKNLNKLDESKLGFLNSMVAKDQEASQKFTAESESAVGKYCETSGIKDEQAQVIIRDAIAAVILNTPALMQRWQSRDASVIPEAIKTLESSIGKKSATADAQALSGTKAKVEQVKQPLPNGGLPAPITKEKKLTEEQRLDAAFAMLSKGKGA
jgi:hypothetical protein